jgi:hypothetical protein
MEGSGPPLDACDDVMYIGVGCMSIDEVEASLASS